MKLPELFVKTSWPGYDKSTLYAAKQAGNGAYLVKDNEGVTNQIPARNCELFRINNEMLGLIERDLLSSLNYIKEAKRYIQATGEFDKRKFEIALLRNLLESNMPVEDKMAELVRVLRNPNTLKMIDYEGEIAEDFNAIVDDAEPL